jgi:hypothetical protein
MIGQDFEKIHFDIWGFHFLEPNALIGDLILFGIAFYFSLKIKNLNNQHPFFKNWRRFYLLFSLSFLIGGIGHFCFNYLGLWGRYPSWIIGMLATYFICLAQFSLWPKQNQQQLFKNLAALLLFIGIALEIYVFNTQNLSLDQSKGLTIPSIISGIGFVFSLFILGIYYQRTIHPQFKYFWMAVLTLLPNAYIQGQKLNLAPWFDRNDFSHILLGISLYLYWKGIKAYKG